MSSWHPLLSDHLRAHARPLIVIVGPTASGKTALSLDVASSISSSKLIHGWNGAEIVNADSRQLYRGVDRGTAKLSREERRGIPHHLLDILDPREDLTVADYQRRAEEIIAALHGAHIVPVLTGGSMLYVSAVIDGLSLLPPAPPSVRERLEKEYDEDGGDALYRKLQEIDPEAALSMHRRNKPYVIRALEILETTGRSASSQKQRRDPGYDLLILGIDRPRQELVTRIDERTKELLSQGWVEEVQALREQGYTRDDPGMRSHGYREIFDALSQAQEQGRTLASVKDDRGLFETIAAKTRQYAKRQMTWWKRDPRIHWIGSEG